MHRRLLLLAAAAPALSACREAPPADTGDPPGDAGHGGPDTVPGDDGDPAALFPTDRVLEVVLTVDDADWRALRAAEPTWFARYDGEGCLDAPATRDTTDHPATLVVDGVAVGPVEVRGEDDWRHADATRPSLRIDVDPDDTGRRLHGVRRLHLANLARDPGAVRTCAVLDALGAMGRAAPRCALAHLVVDGEDLGVYAHVEDLVHDVLPAAYGEALDVYAGDDADFRAGWTGGFDPVGADTDAGAAPIAALTAALAAGDDTALTSLRAVADVDGLARAWADEVLFEQTAGYAAARGPVWVVHPADGLTVLLPGAPDVSLGAAPPATPLDYVGGAIPSRLATIAPGLLPAALSAALDAWDDDATAADVDRLAALARPVSTVDAAVFEASLATAAAFVADRRAVLEAALADGDAAPGPEPTSPCLIADGGIALTFATTWGTRGEDAIAVGESTATTVQGRSTGGAVAGPAGDGAGYTLGWAQGADTAEAGFALAGVPAGPGAVDLDGVHDVAWLRVEGEVAVQWWVLHDADLVFTAHGTGDREAVEGWYAGVRYRADAWAPALQAARDR